MNTISVIKNTDILDRALTKLQASQSGEVADAINTLFSDLYTLRQQSSAEEWRAFASVACRRHSLLPLLHQDPFTRRAFHKPRGYAGDAVMLDFIYASEDGLAHPSIKSNSALGQQICVHLSNNAPASRAVRDRRRVVIRALNDLTASHTKPYVLSLACGHAREAKRCAAFLDGRFGRFVAMDQDKESLATVSRELAPLGVTPLAASVRDILTNRVEVGRFDLIYSTGLYDYLTEPVGQRLCEKLLDMLNPGGRFLIANITPTLPDAAYMEAYTDWWLIYRTERQLLRLADTLPNNHVESVSLLPEEHNHFAFLEVVRKG